MAQDTNALISQLVEDLGPVRPLRFRAGAALALAGLGIAIGLVALFGGFRPDLMAGQPSGLFLLTCGLFGMLALACGAAVVLMSSPRVGSGRNGWGWALAMAGLVPASALVLGLARGSEAWAASAPALGVECMVTSLGLGLLTGGALVLWLRRGAPASPERAGLLTGIAAGAAGVFALSLACPIDTVMHVGLWHGLAVVAGALLGRVVVPPLVRW